MIANAAWLLEFWLAAFGCAFFFRRRMAVIWTWLGFRALADVVCAVILNHFGPQAYNWADYLQRQAQYALIALVSVYTVSQVLREHPRTRKAYLWLLGAIALASVLLFHAKLPSAANVLRFEIWAEITLSGFVALAMGTANGKAPRPWGMIAIGLVVLGSSDLLVTALRLHGFRAEGIYPIGEIISLGILAWAGWKDWQLGRRLAASKMEEIRMPIPLIVQMDSAIRRDIELTGAYVPLPPKKPGARTAAAIEMLRQKYLM